MTAPCLHGEGANVMGGGGLEIGSVDGHEQLFIACSRDKQTVSCMAAIWASEKGPGCESAGTLCGADSPNEARSTSSSSKLLTEPTDEDLSLASSRTLSAFVGSARRDDLQLLSYSSQYVFAHVWRMAAGLGAVVLLPLNGKSSPLCCPLWVDWRPEDEVKELLSIEM